MSADARPYLDPFTVVYIQTVFLIFFIFIHHLPQHLLMNFKE